MNVSVFGITVLYFVLRPVSETGSVSVLSCGAGRILSVQFP
jgi:hypothetical protein